MFMDSLLLQNTTIWLYSHGTGLYDSLCTILLRMEKEMNLNEYLLLQEAVSTTALEREMTEEEVIAVHDSIMNKLWGTND